MIETRMVSALPNPANDYMQHLTRMLVLAGMIVLAAAIISCGEGDSGDSNSCEGVSCSGHGSCDNGTCICDTGYAEDDCSGCADGYVPSGDDCILDSGIRGTGYAIPWLKFYVRENTAKYITLAAWSEDITYIHTQSSDFPNDPNTRYDAAFASWTIAALPLNGELYDNGTLITSAPHHLTGHPDQLAYLPDTDYVGTDSFSFYATDSTGATGAASVTLIVESTTSLPEGFPPLPSIADTPYASVTNFVVGTDWYIDSDTGDDDTAGGGGQGTPDAPRQSLPPHNTVFAAGTVVFIRGDTPLPTPRAGVRWFRYDFDGAPGNPVIISGLPGSATKPLITSDMDDGDSLKELRYYGNNFIIEGLNFKNLNFYSWSDGGTDDDGHKVFRHMEVGDYAKATGGGSAFGQSNGGNIVIENVHIHHCGGPGTEVHGITSVVPDVWVLNCHIHHNGGDSIQLNSNATSRVWIGRTHMHSDGENAVDIKREDDVAVFECYCWDYRSVSGFGGNDSDGAALLANVDESNNPPEYLWFCRNHIWDCVAGVRHQGHEVYTVGNVMWQLNGSCMLVGNNDHPGEMYTEAIVDNIFYRYNRGIYVWTHITQTLADRQYKGNIFGPFRPGAPDQQHIVVGNGIIAEGSLDIDNNNYSDTAVIRWGGANHDLTWMRANTSHCVNSHENRDPLFTNESNLDFAPSAGSPVVDDSILHDPYSRFQTRYGRSMAVAIDGTSLPSDSTRDMGAFER